MPDRNPSWQRDELILALDLYFHHRPDKIGKSHPEVVALSTLLNALPLHSDRPDRERFRNANGTYMKLCNFLALDPSYHGKGLERGGRLERTVWNEFSADRERLADLAAAIRHGHQTALATVSGLTEEPEEEEFPEGRILYRLHRARERSAALVKRAKSSTERARSSAPSAASTSRRPTGHPATGTSSATIRCPCPSWRPRRQRAWRMWSWSARTATG